MGKDWFLLFSYVGHFEQDWDLKCCLDLLFEYVLCIIVYFKLGFNTELFLIKFGVENKLSENFFLNSIKRFA